MGNADLRADMFGDYLDHHVPGFHGLRSITKVGDGQSNPTYIVSAASGRYVLRAKPTGTLLKSAHQVDREFRVMNALKDTDIPVPTPLHLSEGEPIGRMYYVMTYVDGYVITDPTAPELATNEDRTALYDAMCATLARLHSIDPVAVGLADFGKPGNYYGRQMDRWVKQYRAAETDLKPEAESLINWLSNQKLPGDSASAIVHGDYRLGNMITRREKPEIAAVLDWELSTLGNPIADLAYQCMSWRMPYSSEFKGLEGIDRARFGIPSEEAYVESYCQRRGISMIEDWDFHLVFQFFRLGAITQGVYKRSLDGNASNPKATLMNEAAHDLMRRGAELIGRSALFG